MTNNDRVECQIADIKALHEYIEKAKSQVKFGSPAWNTLDLAEARLMGLGMFTAMGADR